MWVFFPLNILLLKELRKNKLMLNWWFIFLLKAVLSLSGEYLLNYHKSLHKHKL